MEVPIFMIVLRNNKAAIFYTIIIQKSDEIGALYKTENH